MAEIGLEDLIYYHNEFVAELSERMEAIKKISKKATEMGGLIAFWLGSKLTVVVTDAEVIDFVVKRFLEKDDSMMVMRLASRNGSAFAPVKIWRRRRRLLAPIFNKTNLNRFTSIFAKQARVLAERLRHCAGDGPFAVEPYVSAYSLDSVCESTFGVNVRAQSALTHPVTASITKLWQLGSSYICKPYLHNWTVLNIVHYLNGGTRENDVLYNFVENAINDTRERLTQGARKPESDQDFPKNRVKTFLELFMESSKEDRVFTPTEIREEAIVVMGAATDTTSIAICFTIMMLGRYPDVQEKVFEEIRNVLGEPFRTPTMEDIDQFKYLDVVIKESMRLYPPVPLIIRKVEEDVTLPTGVTLLKGCSIIVAIWALHRNPKYWGPDADCFRPERFYDIDLPHPAYIPFSTGRRGCLGYKFAINSMKTTLVTILQQFRVLPAEKGSKTGLESNHDEMKNHLPVTYGMLMKETHNFQIRLQQR